MTETYDQRVATLAVASRLIEEADLGLADGSRTLKDISDAEFSEIVSAADKNDSFNMAILASGISFASAAAVMGTSLGTLGLAAGGAGILGMLGLPILTPFVLVGYLLKKKKEREKKERMEKELMQAEKLALQKIIRKQNELITALKKVMEELHIKQAEIEKNTANTMEYAKQQEERVVYMERLLKMMSMASEAIGSVAA